MNRHCRSRMPDIGEMLGRNGCYDCHSDGQSDRDCASAQSGCGMALAIAYVPAQPFGNLYPAEKALLRGTLFADLDKPYEGGCRR